MSEPIQLSNPPPDGLPGGLPDLGAPLEVDDGPVAPAGRAQQRVRRNEWHRLDVPGIGDYEPRLSVSVVIPAWNAGRLLPVVLAGLAAQTYPQHLLEVVVADDGPGAPGELQLPEIRPEGTVMVPVGERSAGGWGRANACHTGAMAASGDVVHWLDADMLVERDHVLAQLRWHHTVDYAVVLGHKWFVDPVAVLAAPLGEVHAAAAADRLGDFFADQPHEPHDWVEAAYDRTGDLRWVGPRALRTHVGATASLRRELYLDAGGMDTRLRLGEDIELGYKLAEAGAFFVPERGARSWHLGPSHVMDRREIVNDYNDPFLADRVPDLRPKRKAGRSYTVPYLDVVLDTRLGRAGDLGGGGADGADRADGADGADGGSLDHAAVIACVDAVLGSSVSDLVVTLLGDWSALDDARTSPLDDPAKSVRLIHESYRADGRVRLLETLDERGPSGRPDAMLRLWLSSAEWAPRHRTLSDLAQHLELTHDGLRQVILPDGSTARLERTAAYARARRLAPGATGPELDDVVDEVAGTAWMEGGDLGFVPSREIYRPGMRGTASRPLSDTEAWTYIEESPGGRNFKPERWREIKQTFATPVAEETAEPGGPAVPAESADPAGPAKPADPAPVAEPARRSLFRRRRG